MCLVAAGTSVLLYLIIDKGGNTEDVLIRASYFQTQGGVGEVDIPRRFVQQQQRTTPMCTVAADASIFCLLSGTCTLSLELTQEMHDTRTISHQPIAELLARLLVDHRTT